MPQRAFQLFDVLAGLAAVALLALAGADLYLAARRGPPRFRRWVAAGLAALVWAGLVSCSSQPAHPATAENKRDLPSPQARDRAPSPAITPGRPEEGAKGEDRRNNPALAAWSAFLVRWRAFWRQASAWNLGDVVDEEEVAASIESLDASIASLAREGVLEEDQVRILKEEMNIALGGRRERGDPPGEGVTCYIPLPNAVDVAHPEAPLRISLDRLANRIPLLAGLAEGQTLRPEVLTKTLQTVEAHLYTLSRPEFLEEATEEERREIDGLRHKVEGLVKAIRAR